MKFYKILYSHDDIILRGRDNIPSALFATPNFKLTSLPENLRKNVRYLQSISFKQGFGTGMVFDDGQYMLPEWLSKLSTLKLIDLRFFSISNFATIKKLPLEYLLLCNVSIMNRKQVIKDIESMRSLKYLIQDDVFTAEEISDLTKVSSKLNCITIKDYTKMIIDKKINFDTP